MDLRVCKSLFFFGIVIFVFMSVNRALAQVIIKGGYVGVEGGYSFSNNVDLKPQQSNRCVEVEGVHGCWLNTSQSFESTFGQSPVFGVKVGYRISSLVSAEGEYTRRNSFNWYKNFPGNFSGEPNTSTASRRRQINTIENQMLMANINFISPRQYFCVYPYLTAGIGIAWNKLGDLTSVNLTNGNRATITGGTIQSMAWQIGFGINYMFSYNWMVDLKYRLLNMGKFSSGTRDIFDNVNQPIAPLTAENALTNEIMLGINYNF